MQFEKNLNILIKLQIMGKTKIKFAKSQNY